MKKLLVTGGMGFIGSNFIIHVLEKYEAVQIYNLDSLTYAGNKQNLAEVEHLPNYHFIHGDITDKLLVNEVMGEGIDIVVHFAAESHVDRSIQEPYQFVNTNVMGTHCLLEAARQNPIQKFIHVSTDEVYGSLRPTGYFTEETSLSPNSPYSASKAGSDLLARSYYETFGLPVVITRCSNNYGPRQFPEKLIPLAITNVLENKPISIYGDGKNIRDWLHVKDHCLAIDKVIEFGKLGEVYNVGGNNEHTNIDIAHRILHELGKPTTLLQFVKDRLGHDRRYAIDAGKIKRHLGWQPSYDFEAGLKETIAWYENHTAWWKAIVSGEYRE